MADQPTYEIQPGDHVEDLPAWGKRPAGGVRVWTDETRAELLAATCTPCRRLVPAEELVRNSKRPGGHALWCLACNRDYLATYNATPARRAAIAAYRRARVATGETAAEQRRHRARLRARTEPEIALDRARLHPSGRKPCYTCREDLPLDAYTSNILAADGLNRDCRPCAARAVARRAEKAIAALAPFAEDRDNFRCYLCDRPATALGIPYHQEHSFPEALGGSSHPANLHWACADCNLSKNDRYVTDWTRYDNGELTYPYAAAVADYVVEERHLPAKKDLPRMTPRSSTPGPNGLPVRVLAKASPEAVAAALRVDVEDAA